MGEAGVEGVSLVYRIGWGGEEDDSALEGALEVVGCDLADGVSVGVHFVDVFAQGNPGVVAVFAAIFGVKCMDGAFDVGGC